MLRVFMKGINMVKAGIFTNNKKFSSVSTSVVLLFEEFLDE